MRTQSFKQVSSCIVIVGLCVTFLALALCVPKMAFALEGDAHDESEVNREVSVLQTDISKDGSEAVLVTADDLVVGNVAVDGDQSAVSYDYEATLYDQTLDDNGMQTGGDYPGVYTAEIEPNNADADNAPTIGIPSIADATLAEEPTLQSPAIINGAAVGFEEKTGPVEYTEIKPRVAPYTYFRYSIVEEAAQDGTTHKKLTGFDGTYVILRINLTSLLENTPGFNKDTSYLHVKQDDNRALLVAVGMTDNTFVGQPAVAKDDYKAAGIYKTGSYRWADLLDPDGDTPFLDVILFSTASNVAGADAGKEGALNGDVQLHFYVDETAKYNDVTYDPQSQDQNHIATCLEKFYDTAAATANAVSNFVVKGSDLALETMVADSGGVNKDTNTTYWSLEKSLQKPYYDQSIDKSASDPGCGRTVKLMSEVAVIEGMALTGNGPDDLRKRTLDVNSFDIQIANNTSPDSSTYTAGLTLSNAWLTIADLSNTTGAELAVGNNARMVIESGGKLIIDETCQLEVEWDGATTAPQDPAQAQAQASAVAADTLNNGLIDLRAGGELLNNGVITVEGTEGKPLPPETEPQPVDQSKGCGELTIQEGAKLTNNGCLLVYGKLYNMGTLINNGKYDVNPIVKQDPDNGEFTYHRGIQVAWKDDVTQPNVFMGELNNGKDRNGNTQTKALLKNKGDIVLTPGKLENYGVIKNAAGANVYVCAVDEAIIPITPTQEAPTVVTKRITLDPPVPSVIDNYGLIVNCGQIMPASVELKDNTSFGTLTPIGKYPELFQLNNYGKIINGCCCACKDKDKDACENGGNETTVRSMPKTADPVPITILMTGLLFALACLTMSAHALRHGVMGRRS